MLAGIPTFLSGIIARFSPLMVGGIAFWVCAVAAYFFPGAGMFIAAAAVLTGYIIPGYMLKRKVDHDSL